MSDPQTPEEMYEHERECWRQTRQGSDGESFSILGMIDALRDMIASQDAELGRLTDTVNRQEWHITTLISDVRHLARKIASDNPPAPDAVALPASLVAALGGARKDGRMTALLVREYDAWKAGQTR